MRKTTFQIVVILMSLVASLPALAGWVWTEDAEGTYAGTASPWAADSSVTGKWVKLGQNNRFLGNLNVTGGTNLTIDGATVNALKSVDGTTYVGRVSQDATETTLTIQNGGKLMLENTLSVSDSSGVSVGRLVLNNGTLESLSEIRIGFHWLGYADITNGGSLKTSNILRLGGENRLGRGYVTVGGLDSETNFGTVSSAAIHMGANGPSTFTVNRGTVTSSVLTIGTSNEATAGTADVVVNVNDFGVVNITDLISISNHATKNASLNVQGGTVTAKRIMVGDAAGKGTMNIENGTQTASVQASEHIVVGKNGVGELNLKSGTIFIGVVADGTTTYKSMFLGGYSAGERGSGTLNISGGTADWNFISVGEYGTGAMTMTGGVVTSHGETFLANQANSSGTLDIGVDGGENLAQFNMLSKLNLGQTGTGTMNLKSGTVTVGNEILIGNNATGNGTLNLSGGEMTVNGNVKIGNSGTGSFVMTGGSFSASGTTSVNSKSTFQISGGTFSTSALTTGSGNTYLGIADAQTRADVTVAKVWNLNGNNVPELCVRNADVKAGEINVGNSGSAMSTLDIGAGGVVTILPASTAEGNTGVLRISSGGTGLLYVHDGGKFVHNGARFLAGDGSTKTAYVTIDGAGSLVDVNTADFCLGYHGSAVVNISNGGTLDAVGNISLGVNNEDGTVAPSVLTLSGEGSLIKTTSQFSIGSSAQQGILNLNASRMGMGCIEVGTLNRVNSGSEINFGINHGLTIIEKDASTAYTVIKAGSLTNWVVNRNDLWNVVVDGGTVTAQLRSDKQQAGKLDLKTVSVEIVEELQTAGWIELDAQMTYNIQLGIEGASDPATMQRLAAWFSNDELGGTMEVSSNSIRFSDLQPSAGSFVWDLSEFNALNGTALKLSSVEAFVPEPCSWLLLILGGVGICVLGKRNMRSKEVA